ncbi:MAG: septum formation initiator family protein [Myxococcales bacterium]|nr:septum formation initiator family protein [Myxococcales bacterium]
MERLSSVAAWLLPFSLLVVAIVAVPLRILDARGLPRYRALRQELEQVRDENERYRRAVLELRRDVDGLRNDPGAIERIARDERGMVREDELVFQFPE